VAGSWVLHDWHLIHWDCCCRVSNSSMLLMKWFDGIFSTLSPSLTWNSVRHTGHSKISGTLAFALTAFLRWVATKFSKQCLQNEWKHVNVRGSVKVSVQMEHSNSVSHCFTGAESDAVAIALCFDNHFRFLILFQEASLNICYFIG
jgi:hypothetical protein